MGQQIKPEHRKCANCLANTDNGVLVSIRNEFDNWSLMLCPNKVKNKLLKSGYTPAKMDEVYERFVQNFSRFPVCKLVANEHTPH